MSEKLSFFINILKAQNSSFTCYDFIRLNMSSLNANDFVYIDPPYLIICATYNEQNGWNEYRELYAQKIMRSVLKCAEDSQCLLWTSWTRG